MNILIVDKLTSYTVQFAATGLCSEKAAYDRARRIIVSQHGEPCASTTQLTRVKDLPGAMSLINRYEHTPWTEGRPSDTCSTCKWPRGEHKE